MIEILKWKSFTLVTNVYDENDDDVQNIAKKLTINAIENNLCVIIHNNEEGMNLHSYFPPFLCKKALTSSTVSFNNIK